MQKQSAVIIGNWKLQPQSHAESQALVAAIIKALPRTLSATVAVAPPFIYLADTLKKIGRRPLFLAAQDVSTEPLGPFTGDISAAQLKDIGVSYVIIGHSERRARGETDEQIKKKVLLALKYKLTPVVCVGEVVRDTQGSFYSAVEAQVEAVATMLDATSIKKVIFAYEPVWAIGTGKTATPADVKEMQLFLYRVLVKRYGKAVAERVTLLYGGSVKPDNALALHQEGGMRGFLVGGASLKAQDFINIIRATA